MPSQAEPWRAGPIRAQRSSRYIDAHLHEPIDVTVSLQASPGRSLPFQARVFCSRSVERHSASLHLTVHLRLKCALGAFHPRRTPRPCMNRHPVRLFRIRAALAGYRLKRATGASPGAWRRSWRTWSLSRGLQTGDCAVFEKRRLRLHPPRFALKWGTIWRGPQRREIPPPPPCCKNIFRDRGENASPG